MSSETYDGEVVKGEKETQLPTPRQTKIDLRDAHAIRRELGAVYRDMRNGTIESQEGTRLAYVLDMVRKAYETCELEKRIENLETEVKK